MPSNISDTKSIAKSITKSIASKKLTASYNSTVAVENGLCTCTW